MAIQGTTVCLLVVALLGCATVQKEHTADREKQLVEAGFRQMSATTAPQAAQLQRLPVRKIARVPFGSEVRYVYADSDGCRCLFVGTQEAYDAFLRAVTREFIDNDYADTATPDPAVSAREWTRYQDLARSAVLDPGASATLDWSAWPGAE